MQFIRYRPAAVLIDKEQKVHLIKEPDDLETVNFKERLPDYLRLT
jgi:diaminopimelate decarboxylase